MRRTIFGFNQKKAMELGLSTNELLLLNYIHLAQTTPKMIHKELDGVSYVYLSHKHIRNDLPILGYSEGTLKNKLSDLKSRGAIQSVLDRVGSGTMAYYAIAKSVLEQLFEDYAEEENNEQVTKLLPAKSQNDYLSSNENVTSYNNLDNNNLKDNNIILKNNTAKMQSPNNLENSLNNIPKRNIPLMDSISDKEYKNEKEERPKRMNLYEKCMLEINTFTEDENLRAVLKVYLETRLKMKDKPILGIGQWKGLLKTLGNLSGDKVAIVERATERGWGAFYELKDFSYNRKQDNRSVFAEDYGVKSVRPEDVEGGESSGQVF